MALFGPFSLIEAQVADPRILAAFGYVTEALLRGSEVHTRIGQVAPGATGRVELAGGVFALEQAYAPKARPEAFFESHRRYIDLQVIVEGEELMEVENVSRLTISVAYDPERDLVKYADTAEASVLRMRAGDLAIFFPEDGHMPSLHWRGPGLVRKTVVKVPVG